MCDYSLEMYRSRPAVAGEAFQTSRFPSGSIGLVSPKEPHTAICLACDMRLMLSDLSADLTQRYGESAAVTFVRMDTTLYRDGVRFDDGTVLSLQELGPGIGIRVMDDLIGDPMPQTVRHAPVLEPAE